MYSFKDDYSEGAHIKILEELMKSNTEQYSGYGTDKYTLSAIQKIKKSVENDAVDVHLISGGTQTNLIAISSFLRPHEAVISAHTGHIAVHETGAIEQTGHKVITVESSDGKINIDQIKEVLAFHHDEHLVKPRLIYISNPTEIGTVYYKEELEAIYQFSKENDLLLYADGARLGTALEAKGYNVSYKVMCDYTDAFFIGGTKNGALLGEALIIKNETLKPDFRYLIKQKGALLAKGRVLGIQFDVLFTDQLLNKLARHANELADKLQSGIEELGFSMMVNSPTNQIFPILPNEVIKKLESDFAFHRWQPISQENTAIRLVTSWATEDKAVEYFLSQLSKYI